jgi:hypothetical protein
MLVRMFRIFLSTCVLVGFNLLYPFSCIGDALQGDYTKGEYVEGVQEIWRDYLYAIEGA